MSKETDKKETEQQQKITKQIIKQNQNNKQKSQAKPNKMK